MRDALSLPQYFGNQFAGECWANWRALLLAIAGEPLESGEVETLKALTGRQKWPQEAVREFWAVVPPLLSQPLCPSWRIVEGVSATLWE
jgi:hypothetical protein